MKWNSNSKRSVYVKHLFGPLTEKYDRANHWMTWGQDMRWRREVINRAQLSNGGRLLDVGTGTGDLALEARRRDASLFVVGVDFAPAMISVARRRPGVQWVCWVNNDALDLPFPADYFDAVVSGYLLRNVDDVEKSLDEQYRVLKAGGTMVCLDTTPPPADFWHLPVRLYLQYMIPVIGGWVTGDKQAYHYLPASTAQFLTATELAASMHRAGFREVGYRCFMGGCMAIHWGIK